MGQTIIFTYHNQFRGYCFFTLLRCFIRVSFLFKCLCSFYRSFVFYGVNLQSICTLVFNIHICLSTICKCLDLCLCVQHPYLLRNLNKFSFESSRHRQDASAIIKKPIDDSDPSLWEMERERVEGMRQEGDCR